MKKFSSYLLSLLLLLSLATSSCAGQIHILGKSMGGVSDTVAAYTFNSVWTDSSGNGNTVTPTGATFDTSIKKVGTASSNYDGINDKGTVTNSASIDITGDLSISLWLYVTNWTSFPSVLMKAKTGTDEGITKVQYGLFINGDGVPGKLQGIMGNGTSFASVLLDANLILTTWQHIMLIRNGNTVTMYLNNVAQAGTDTLSGSLHTDSFDMDIGHDIRYASSQRVLNGKVDVLQIFNKALTSIERSTIYNNGAGTENIDGIVSNILTPATIGGTL